MKVPPAYHKELEYLWNGREVVHHSGLSQPPEDFWFG